MFKLELLDILYALPGIIIGFAIHEFSHAFTADRLGDPTPRNMGRLTLDPKVHIDLIGLMCIIFFGFGWAKPVMISPRNFKHPRRDDILVSVAGPVSNLILSVSFLAIIKIMLSVGIGIQNAVISNLYILLLTTVNINVRLFVFNLLPIPGLDGFHILANFIPARFYKIVYTMQQYAPILLIAFIVLGSYTNLLNRMEDAVVTVLLIAFRLY